MTSITRLVLKEFAVLVLLIVGITLATSYFFSAEINVVLLFASGFILYFSQALLVASLAREKLPIFWRRTLTPVATYIVESIDEAKNERLLLNCEIDRLKLRATNRKNKMATLVRDFRDSLSVLPDAIIALDRNNRIEWWNKAAGDLIGLSGSIDLKKRIEIFFPSGEFRRYIDNAKESDPVEIVAPAFPDKLLSVRVTPYGDNQRLFQAQDITLVKQLERVRQDFVANASHELRTPLTVIHGYLETLIDQEISNPEQTRSAMTQMYSQTTRIKGIVEDMLTLANLERGEKPRSEWVDIGDLIAQVRLEAQALSGEKDHEISVEEQYRCAINWNPQELHSLISNLVINAVKYTPASGVIKLRWAITTEGGCFSVQDTGIGIERSHLSRLTERFYRVDVARSRESGGTGLGLAIVKHVLGRMGGELSITSEPEQGSCFTCTFPSELVRQIPQ